MLILTRRVTESIVIGGGITVTVLDIKGGQVRIGIDAPSSIPIHRGELIEKARKEAKDGHHS
jgi:carbon storage regulator CsrA